MLEDPGLDVECNVCGEVYPATGDYFPYRNRRSNKLRITCRKCINAKEKERCKSKTKILSFAQELKILMPLACGSCGTKMEISRDGYICEKCRPEGYYRGCAKCPMEQRCRSNVKKGLPVCCERHNKGDEMLLKMRAFEEMRNGAI
jgi:hypothetical protein